MANETNKVLTDYLSRPEVTPLEDPQMVVEIVNDPTATTSAIVQEIVNELTPPSELDKNFQLDELMTDLMAKVKRIGMCAKDLHYRAKGKPFYGIHQLADLAYKIEEDTDHIAEIYFMGDRTKEPPTMIQVYEKAIHQSVWYPRNDKYYLGGLIDICRSTIHAIENIKSKHELKAGVSAVIDSISENCLLTIGLLDQTAKGN